MVPGLIYIGIVYKACYSSMRVDNIAGLLIQAADRLGCLLFICITAVEISQFFLHLRRDLIAALSGELLHISGIRLGIITCNVIDQTL